MAADETKVFAGVWDLRTVNVRTKDSLGLSMGEIRRFVAEADALEIPDKETIQVEKLGKSYTYVDEYYAKEIHVRSQVKATG